MGVARKLLRIRMAGKLWGIGMPSRLGVLTSMRLRNVLGVRASLGFLGNMGMALGMRVPSWMEVIAGV